MQITDKERKARQHKKELKSLRNKLSTNNKIWFDSLGTTKQYDVLFIWKSVKYRNNLKSPIVVYRRGFDYSKRKTTYYKGIRYPASLKHLVDELRMGRRYSVSKSKYREQALKSLFG